MSHRHEFSEHVRRLTAVNANYLCEMCGISTRIAMNSLHHFGSAAHIHAAAPNGPRFDPNKTKEFITSYENALWLCKNCHENIDKDANKFTAQKLLDLKAVKEHQTKKEANPILSAIALRDVHQVRSRAQLVDPDDTFSLLSFVPILSIIESGSQYNDKVHIELFKSLLLLFSLRAGGAAHFIIPRKTLTYLLCTAFDYYDIEHYWEQLMELCTSIVAPSIGFVLLIRVLALCA